MVLKMLKYVFGIYKLGIRSTPTCAVFNTLVRKFNHQLKFQSWIKDGFG